MLVSTLLCFVFFSKFLDIFFIRMVAPQTLQSGGIRVTVVAMKNLYFSFRNIFVGVNLAAICPAKGPTFFFFNLNSCEHEP